MPQISDDPCSQPLDIRPADCPVTFADVLRKEIDQINLARRARGVPEEKTKDSLIGLAFSGGGIRSATFNLGILQGLARNKLLGKFDYLSTVSGGGYIGSWLAAVTKRYHDSTGEPFSEIEKALVPENYQPSLRHERSFLHWLRLYSNYLTPNSSLISGDTWAMIGTWTRNCFLNQTILGLLFLSFFVFCDAILVMLVRSGGEGWTILKIGLGFLFIAALFMGRNVVKTFPKERRKSWFERVEVRMTVLAPFMVASVLVNSGLWRLVLVGEHQLRSGGEGWIVFRMPVWQWAVGGADFYFLVWAFVVLSVHGWDWLFGNKREKREEREEKVRPTALLCSSAVAGAISGCLMREYVLLLAHLQNCAGVRWAVTALGPAAVMLVMLACGAFHQGLTGRGLRDLVREWWARLGGYMMILTAAWLLVASICVFGPLLMLWIWVKLQSWSLVPAALWVLHNYLGIKAAKSAATSGKPGKPKPAEQDDTGIAGKIIAALKSPKVLDALAKAAPYVFAIGLLLLLSTAVHIGSGLAFDPGDTKTLWQFGGNSPASSSGQIAVVDGSASKPTVRCDLYWRVQKGGDTSRCQLLPWLFGVAVMLFVACLLLSWRVDVNDFSLHHFYRNRLVRCYLGASNSARNPHPFTGFDEYDDLPLADFAVNYPGPYPLLNASLNITSGAELGYATRRAKSFVFTPQYCGYETNITGEGKAWFLRTNSPGETLAKSFAPTALGRSKKSMLQIHFKGGIKLGTAMAISGAAASPNMGYYTSAATGLFMTLFDVRLGWWMGNPRYWCKWAMPGPRLGLGYLFSELIAQSDQQKSFVYLSDGGHFENLAVYELLRRHCKLIVACDADCDGQYQCQNLVDLMEKARTDLGAEIVIDFRQIRPAADGRESEHNFVVGDIFYDPQKPEDRGKFIYVKASMPVRPKTPSGSETMRQKENRLPDDVWQYYDKHITFPHQSTADQWFDELQFESYRALGEFIGIAASDKIKEEISDVLG
ncbi:MAG TPA: patatin-like phospholipase family protein [Terriglobales bacterium]|jgi:predicted acylesterase/phospholipase RssA|nr:patatin-like phospholipase family protein [Terriglobales bacterium]